MTTVPPQELRKLWKRARADADGLLPCVVQDVRSNAVLMVAWVSVEALIRSLESGFATYWSRSRQELWEKGKTSGHRQKLVEVRLDCDADTLLYRVDPAGPACHEGHDTCFSWKQSGSGWKLEPQSVLGEPTGRSKLFSDLENLLLSNPKPALDLGLAEQGAQLGDHAEAVAHALTGASREALLKASADLLFTLVIALKGRQLSIDEVFSMLLERPGVEDG